jgi:predicted permease
MIDTLSQISWVLAGFAIGFVLRRTSIAKESDGAFIFRLVFYVCVPALVFISLAQVSLTRHLLIFSLLASLLYVAGFFAGSMVLRKSQLDVTQKAVFLIGSMGLNSLFAVPFLQSLYGAEGVARYIAYDLVNTVLLYAWAYSVAVRANPAHHGVEGVLRKKLLRSPPLWAIAAGLLVNLADANVPVAVENIATTFSAPTGFLVTLATGIALQPKRSDIPAALRLISVRLGTALLVALVVIVAFDLRGVDRTSVLLFCVAPLAFSMVTFASLENLDKRFAAGVLSISLFAGIVLSTGVAVLFA